MAIEKYYIDSKNITPHISLGKVPNFNDESIMAINNINDGVKINKDNFNLLFNFAIYDKPKIYNNIAFDLKTNQIITKPVTIK